MFSVVCTLQLRTTRMEIAQYAVHLNMKHVNALHGLRSFPLTCLAHNALSGCCAPLAW